MKKQRIARINREIQHTIAEIIRYDLKDPRVSTLTSIIAVDTTNDLKQCKVYVSLFGDDTARQENIEGLKSSAGFIRKKLATKINLRYTPELIFIEDYSIEKGVYMHDKIDKLVKLDDE